MKTCYVCLCYVNRMNAKDTTKQGVQIARINFQMYSGMHTLQFREFPKSPAYKKAMLS
ncbi:MULTISPECIES: DUF6783 domain-containing protein [unclassified Blautia]|uniref:DUF6783 domain-containing protein n=1 Tax=unclassified Blautia TaxID=2648079 RepID=UPI003F8AE806